MFMKFLWLTMLLALSACATPPMSASHTHDTPDGTHRAIQISMHSGVYNTPVQTVMLVYNKWSASPVAVVEGQSLTLSAQLATELLALGPSIVNGEYRIMAEEKACPAGTICGTLVQVSNVAGAEAGANSQSSGGN